MSENPLDTTRTRIVLPLDFLPESVHYHRYFHSRRGRTALEQCVAWLHALSNATIDVVAFDEHDGARAVRLLEGASATIRRANSVLELPAIDEIDAAASTDLVICRLECLLSPAGLIGRLLERHRASDLGITSLEGAPSSVAPLIIRREHLSRLLALELPAAAQSYAGLTALLRRAGPQIASALGCGVAGIPVGELFPGQHVPVADVSIQYHDDVDRLLTLVDDGGSGAETRESWVRLESWFQRTSRDYERMLEPIYGTPTRQRRAASRRMHVLYVSNASGFSGAEESLCQLVRCLPAEACETSALVSLEGTLTDRLRNAGVRIVTPQRAIAPNTAANALYCMRTLKELAPDVVHLNGLDGEPILVAALAQGIPIVVHARNAVFSLYEEYFRSAAHVIAVSEFVKRGLLSLGASDSRITVLYDEADPDWFDPSTIDRAHARNVLGIPDDAFVVGMIARFAPYKRHDVMIRAIEYARERVSNILLLLKGEVFEYTEQFSIIQAALDAHGLRGCVKWVPFVDDIRLVHSAVDALALCSDGEALGRCVVEAMSMTVPVVVTSGGGSHEIVTASQGGLVVPPGDPQALADAIIALAADGVLRQRYGRAGREFVRARLTAKGSAEIVMNLYHQLAGAAVRQPAVCD